MSVKVRRQNRNFFNARTQARVHAIYAAFPNLKISLNSWTDDYGRLIFYSDGQDDAGTWWWADIKSGSAKELGWLYPSVSGERIGPYRMVRYKAADGLEMEGILTLPPGINPTKLPLVVLPHGGPEARDEMGFDWWAQAFASRGYAVWQPNFRGSSGYTVAFRNAGFGEWGRKMQTDISDGVDELAHQGIVDPRRACIVGASYGGYAALAGVTVQQGLYRCAVSVGGVADLNALLSREQEGDRTGTLRYLKDFLGIKSFFNQSVDDISPLKLAKRADVPVLLIHGKDDTVVLFEQSKAMQRALKSAGKPVELVELKGEDHWLSRSVTRKAMLEAAVDFVQRHNPPGALQADSADEVSR